jgi:hypothetical protein
MRVRGYAASINEGYSAATYLLERRGSAARGSRLHHAGSQLGQLWPTVYLALAGIDSPRRWHAVRAKNTSSASSVNTEPLNLSFAVEMEEVRGAADGTVRQARLDFRRNRLYSRDHCERRR